MKNITIQSVLESGKFVNTTVNFGVGIAMVFGFLFIYLVFRWSQNHSVGNNKKADHYVQLSFYTIFSVFIILGLDLYWAHSQHTHWVEKQAKPFIEQQRIQKVNISKASILSDEESQKATSYYTNYKNKKLYSLSLVLDNETDTKMIGKYEISYTLKEGEIPYMEYQKLDTNLDIFESNFFNLKGYETGYYNVKVFMPKEYKFGS